MSTLGLLTRFLDVILSPNFLPYFSSFLHCCRRPGKQRPLLSLSIRNLPPSLCFLSFSNDGQILQGLWLNFSFANFVNFSLSKVQTWISSDLQGSLRSWRIFLLINKNVSDLGNSYMKFWFVSLIQPNSIGVFYGWFWRVISSCQVQIWTRFS